MRGAGKLARRTKQWWCFFLSKEGSTPMRRPNAAGTTLQALEPMAKKLTEMVRALQGAARSVVRLVGVAPDASTISDGQRVEQAAAADVQQPEAGACSSAARPIQARATHPSSSRS